jgi:hypothetical protein
MKAVSCSTNEQEEEKDFVCGATRNIVCSTTSDTSISSCCSDDSSIPPEEQYIDLRPDKRSEGTVKKTIKKNIPRVGIFHDDKPPRNRGGKIRNTEDSNDELLVILKAVPAFTLQRYQQQAHETIDEMKEDDSHEKKKRQNFLNSTTTATSKLSKNMNLFSSQKDTCPDRLKELHYLGTHALLLKRTQDYIKVLNDSRRLIKFEMSLQKRRERLKLECARRKGNLPAKPLEGKRQICKTNLVQQRTTTITTTTKNSSSKKKENDCVKKPFNVYAAFKS